MKIISKYKDYYDFLSGIYGEDPKIVLDRRKHISPQILFPQKIILFICGKKIEGFYNGSTFYYGNDLDSIGIRSKNAFYFQRWNTIKEIVRIEYRRDHLSDLEFVDVNPNIVKTEINDKEDCPIIYGGISHRNDFPMGKFPKLKDLNISSLFPPEEIYQMLNQWLSEKITKSENIVDTRNDILKLESKGFNKKRSFRPKMKK